MKKSYVVAAVLAFALVCGIASSLFAAPSVYPTGVTI